MIKDFQLLFSVAVTGSTKKSRKQDKLQRDAWRGLSSFSSIRGMSQSCLRWLKTEILLGSFLNCSFLHPAVNPPLWFTPWMASLSEGFLFDPHFIPLHFTTPSHSSGKEREDCVLRNRAYLTTPNMRNASPLPESLWEPHAGSGFSGKKDPSIISAFSRFLIQRKHHTLT